MIYDIVLDPAEILHKKAAELPIDKINTRPMQKFFKDMIETMYVKEGVGLAAVQVGVASQVCTILKDYNSLNPHEDLVLVNGKYEKASRHQEWDEEGCLSVPGYFGKIKRYSEVNVTGFDHKGNKLKFKASGFFARIIQHEIDHLNGHLYIEKAKDIHKVTPQKKQQI